MWAGKTQELCEKKNIREMIVTIEEKQGRTDKRDY